MHMTTRVILVVSAVLMVCCGGSRASSPTAPSVQTLAGTWRATRAEFVSGSNRVEVVSRGTVMVLTLNAGGTYSQAITDPGQAGQTTTGNWSSSSDVLTLRPTGMSFDIQFDMTFSGNSLMLNGGHVQFDVNADGNAEEAILNMALARQP